ncbi:MAG: hypothetical protein HND42_05555 [Armatimonadetes bacterium]|nr:hypothetical protein [Armatimonadota bacterium]NOG92693.1 hypothetical protein [Armatimonadota bacterium]
MSVVTLHYLTVQDVLWINQEVTKQQNDFKYAQLEEATYFQYGYGQSTDVIEQAGRFLQGFLKMRPFTEGNRATAFVAALTFLYMNGYMSTLSPESALQWVLSIADKKVDGKTAVASIAVPSEEPPNLHPPVRSIVHEVIETYADAVANLTD